MRFLLFIFGLSLSSLNVSCQQAKTVNTGDIEAFFPNLFRDYPHIRDMTISPDGDELYFTVNDYKHKFSMIVRMQLLDDGNWSKPERAAFSGTFPDLEAAFSPDGSRLYFASRRPVEPDSLEPKDWDIWYVERSAPTSEWGHPIRLQEPVNSQGNEYYPSVTDHGDIYFTASREDTKGKEDIYVCRLEDGIYKQAVSLSDSINTEYFEFNAYVHPEEKYLIFSSQRPGEGQGGGDLFISYNKNGVWSKARTMDSLNSPYLDFCPFVDHHEGRLYFTSQRSDISSQYQRPLALEEFISDIKGKASGLNRIFSVKWDDQK